MDGAIGVFAVELARAAEENRSSSTVVLSDSLANRLLEQRRQRLTVVKLLLCCPRDAIYRLRCLHVGLHCVMRQRRRFDCSTGCFDCSASIGRGTV
jgi:hypothetical protein